MTYQQKHEAYKSLITSKSYRHIRDRYIGEHPLCEDCLGEGRITRATEVHHIRRVEGARDLAGMKARLMDCDNLRALCFDCHRRAHAVSGSSFKGKRGVEAKKRDAKEFARRFYGN